MVDVTISVPKELNDVRILIVELVKDLKAGKDFTAISAENLGNLMTALQGVDVIPDEVKGPGVAHLVGLLAGDLGEVFLAKSAV